MNELEVFLQGRARREADTLFGRVVSENRNETYQVARASDQVIVTASRANPADRFSVGTWVVMNYLGGSSLAVGAGYVIISRAPAEQKGLAGTSAIVQDEVSSRPAVTSISPNPVKLSKGGPAVTAYIHGVGFSASTPPSYPAGVTNDSAPTITAKRITVHIKASSAAALGLQSMSVGDIPIRRALSVKADPVMSDPITMAGYEAIVLGGVHLGKGWIAGSDAATYRPGFVKFDPATLASLGSFATSPAGAGPNTRYEIAWDEAAGGFITDGYHSSGLFRVDASTEATTTLLSYLNSFNSASAIAVAGSDIAIFEPFGGSAKGFYVYDGINLIQIWISTAVGHRAMVVCPTRVISAGPDDLTTTEWPAWTFRERADVPAQYLLAVRGWDGLAYTGPEGRFISWTADDSFPSYGLDGSGVRLWYSSPLSVIRRWDDTSPSVTISIVQCRDRFYIWGSNGIIKSTTDFLTVTTFVDLSQFNAAHTKIGLMADSNNIYAVYYYNNATASIGVVKLSV